MRRTTSMFPEDNTVAAGVRAAVLVIVLGSFAAAVDYLGGHPNPASPPAVATMPAVTAMVAGGFGVPSTLRAHEGEVPPPVATF